MRSANCAAASSSRPVSQPARSPVVPGYVVDSGLTYGSRGSGLVYGWIVENQQPHTNWAATNAASLGAKVTVVAPRLGGPPDPGADFPYP